MSAGAEGDDLGARLADLRARSAGQVDSIRSISSDGSTDEVPTKLAYASADAWVRGVFAPTYARRITPTFRWCPRWWAHPEAIVRLEVLWRSWEALHRDPQLGVATWLRDHLDHHLPILTSASGPFADCDPQRHFAGSLGELPTDPVPDGWMPAAQSSSMED